MLKNMRVFIAFRVFLYPGRMVATSFANGTHVLVFLESQYV